MSGDNPRVLELRRRVQADPASIAFAQLAEECRRSGLNDEAVAICRAGLKHHPDYLSARVTLGLALFELGRLTEAQGELKGVLALVPDNLPATRGLAAIEAIEEVHRPAASSPPKVAERFDFEKLSAQLGGPTPPVAPSIPVQDDKPVVSDPVPPSAIDKVELREDDGDPFSVLERQLRDTGDQHDDHERRMVAELEQWLAAIELDRDKGPPA